MRRFKINIIELYYIICMLAFVRIEALMMYPVMDIVYDVLKIMSILLIFIRSVPMILSQRGRKYQKFVYLVVGLATVALLSAVIHQENILEILVRYITMIMVAMMVANVSYRRETKYFFGSLSWLFSCMLILNFVGLLVKPNGIYVSDRIRTGMMYDTGVGVHILGKANAVTPLMIAMLICIIIDDYNVNKKLTGKSFFYSMIVCVSILIMRSSTGIVGIAVFIGIYFMYRFKQAYSGKSINFKLLLLIAVILTLGVTVLNIQEFFAFIILQVLHKDVTLSNRTNVWLMMFQYIREQFTVLEYMIGSGMVDYRQEIFNGRYVHCHNQLFDQFITGGFLGIGLYIKMFYLSLAKVIQRYNEMHNPVAVLIGAALSSYLIMFITEVYTTPMIVILLAIGFQNTELIYEAETLPKEKS